MSCPCELVTIQPVCNPCAKTCTRVAWPYVGWLGIVQYVFEVIGVVIFMLMLTGVLYVDDRVVLGILLFLTSLAVLLWFINTFWMAPCYTTVRTAPTCEFKCGLVLIAKLCPADYAIRHKEDRYQNNDETHLKNSIWTGIAFLIMFIALVAPNGGKVFDNIDNNTDSDGFMHFVIGRIIIGLLIGAYGIGIRALFDGQSDFDYRHDTAVDNDQIATNENLGFTSVFATRALQAPVNDNKSFSRKQVNGDITTW